MYFLNSWIKILLWKLALENHWTDPHWHIRLASAFWQSIYSQTLTHSTISNLLCVAVAAKDVLAHNKDLTWSLVWGGVQQLTPLNSEPGLFTLTSSWQRTSLDIVNYLKKCAVLELFLILLNLDYLSLDAFFIYSSEWHQKSPLAFKSRLNLT